MRTSPKEKLKRNLVNIRGWRTHRKFVVIESDDWGSIRMPDKKTYDILLAKGIRVDNCPYSKYDSLASGEDLTALFDVLIKFKDVNGNPPVITANSVVANPDFEKIRAADFREYHYELFTETLRKYPPHSNSFILWKEGFAEKLFYPQFHGREHLNVTRWMKALNQALPETMLAFNLGLFGLSTTITSEKRKSYLAAFETDTISGEHNIEEIINDGLYQFRKLFKYSSKSFIAPNYIWSSHIEKELFRNKIKYIQGQRIQLSPVQGSRKTKKIHHFTGQTNAHGQIYTTRNCYFEPSLYSFKDSVNECLSQIQTAFKWKKPAIISSHRVNYISSIESTNGQKNLKGMKELFSKIQNQWPEVEFITTDKLGDIISSSYT